MRILLIGGSHLIGYYLLPRLMDEGHHVTVLTRGNRPLSHPATEHLVGDRTILLRRNQVPGEFDAIIDNVAYTAQDCFDVLNAFQDRVTHYIVTSTAFVYPEVEKACTVPSRPYQEPDAGFLDEPPAEGESGAHNEYIYGKRQMEYWLHHDGQSYHLPITIIRPLLQVVGPNSEDGRFAWFWLRVLDGGPIWLPDEARLKAGPCQLSFSGDVAQVIQASLQHPPRTLAVYNAGQPELWTYEEYLHLMAKAVGRPIDIRYAPRATLNRWVGGTYRIPLPYPVAFDVSKTRRVLHVANTPMSDWVRATGQWMSRHYMKSHPVWYETRGQERQWGL